MSEGSDQVDEGEDADPHQVQEVPEQAQARNAGDVGRGQATAVDLVHHHCHPDQATGHVQAVGGHKREER
ncbi:hypothetical protein G6F22_019399 [Rhizopus arrhizus]|nr:hypothetical protein G6F22_019399 [Rhizopus arrhizus]